MLVGLSLRAARGGVVTVIGPNGAGKSTLLNALMGVLPARGRIAYDGHDLGAESLEERRAYAEAFRQHRCLVPADGFYEWTGDRKSRRPFWFHPPDPQPCPFAGLAARARLRDEAGAVPPFTILTTYSSLISARPSLPATTPSRSKPTRSQARSISFRRCEMKMTAMPSCFSPRMTSSNFSVSCNGRLDVGSSRMMSRAP